MYGGYTMEKGKQDYKYLYKQKVEECEKLKQENDFLRFLNNYFCEVEYLREENADMKNMINNAKKELMNE